jgi:hypothetical protein
MSSFTPLATTFTIIAITIIANFSASLIALATLAMLALLPLLAYLTCVIPSSSETCPTLARGVAHRHPT